MAISPDTRVGIGNGLPPDYFYLPKIPLAAIEFPPVPEYETPEEREGREGEERLAFLIATRPDVARVVVHPKFSIADRRGFDVSVDFTPESDQVSVHLQSKLSPWRLDEWINETWNWLEEHDWRTTPHESFVRRRLIPMVSGPSESNDSILSKFDRDNTEIQDRERFERSRRRLVPVFAA